MTGNPGVRATVAAADTVSRAITSFVQTARGLADNATAAVRDAERRASSERDARRRSLDDARRGRQRAEAALSACTEDCGGLQRAVTAAMQAERSATERYNASVQALTALTEARSRLSRQAQTFLAGLERAAPGGQSAAAYRDQLEGYLDQGDSGSGLSSPDRDALSDITGTGHRQLNRSLSDGSLDDVASVASRVNAVSNALQKLPVHEGTVLRGSAGNLTEDQIAEYEPGEVRVEDRFVHASVDPEVADGRFHGNVVWAIDSKRGRRVEAHSQWPSEKEVMFDKFSRFEVLAKDRIEDTGQWLIYMREI